MELSQLSGPIMKRNQPKNQTDLVSQTSSAQLGYIEFWFLVEIDRKTLNHIRLNHDNFFFGLDPSAPPPTPPAPQHPLHSPIEAVFWGNIIPYRHF